MNWWASHHKPYEPVYSCVYIIRDANTTEVLYVGITTKGLGARFERDHIYCSAIHTAEYIECPAHIAPIWERHLIRVLRPPLNKSKGKDYSWLWSEFEKKRRELEERHGTLYLDEYQLLEIISEAITFDDYDDFTEWIDEQTAYQNEKVDIVPTKSYRNKPNQKLGSKPEKMSGMRMVLWPYSVAWSIWWGVSLSDAENKVRELKHQTGERPCFVPYPPGLQPGPPLGFAPTTVNSEGNTHGGGDTAR
jgi:hypothetical protein